MTEPQTTRERIGAIDVGSNSIRLVVAEYDPESGLKVIDEVKDQPRLAVGVSATGLLSTSARARAFAALKRMKEVADRRGVTRLVAVATSAMREARNGQSFARRVRHELGIPLEIIDDQREAQLSWRSVAHHFRLEHERTIVADIGGGSLELIGAVDGVVEVTTSLPMGAVRLTEEYLSGHRDQRTEIASLRRRIRPQLRRALAWRDWANGTLIGSGGSFTNLARMAAARRGILGEAIHGTAVGTGEVESLLEWLCTMNAEQRALVPGLNPQRADIILAGVAVAAELLGMLDATQLTVSAYGLREGLLLEMIGAEHPTKNADPLRLYRDFVDRCHGERRHVEQVRLLALSLYDQLANTLGCTPEERPLLEAAAMLHDVGQLVSFRKHHLHSYQLIMHADRLGLGAADRFLVALISRYHRKSGPSRKDEDFARLPKSDQAIVRRLSGLLRVADGFDRGHTGAVDRLMVTLTDKLCTIHASPRLQTADVALEVWGAGRKADVLARALDRDIAIEGGTQPETQPTESVPAPKRARPRRKAVAESVA